MNDAKDAKVALIAGASGGIGEATARLLADQGFKIIGTYFRNSEKAAGLGTLKNCRMIFCDLSKEESAGHLLEEIKRREKKLDVVVNAISPPLKLKPFEVLTAAEFEEDFTAILMAARHLLKFAIPIMKQSGGGVILHLLTAALENPQARMSSYVAAKSALLGLTLSLAVELDRYKIRTLGLSPSFVETPLLKAFPAKLIEIEGAKNQGGKILQPQEVARMILHMIQAPEEFPNGTHTFLRSRNELAAYV